MLDVPLEGPHVEELPTESGAAGKLATSGSRSQVLEVDQTAHSQTDFSLYCSPASPTSVYRLPEKVSGTQVSLLLDMGAAVTLLHEDVWIHIMANSLIHLKQWSRLNLVGTRWTSHNIRSSANVQLKLEGERFTSEVVVVSPLTCEGILGLDFLQEQQATVDLGTKVLLLRKKGHQVTLNEPSRKPRQDNT